MAGTSSAAEGTVPRGALIGAGLLLGLALALVGIARLTGYGPAKPAPSRAVASYEIRFEDRSDGAVLVYAADAEPRLIEVLAPGTNGFVRGVLRGLVRDRRAAHIGPAPAFRLTRWADGRLSLDDPSTHRHVDLEVFGSTNAAAFADILAASARPKDKS